MTSKICSKCKTDKSIGEFGNSNGRPISRCKACCVAATSAWYVVNLDKIRVAKAAYRAANADKIKLKKAAYRAANLTKVRAYDVAYKTENRAELKAKNAAHYAANVEDEKAKAAVWRAANPEKLKATKAAYCAANGNRLKAANAAWRAANIDKLKEYDVAYRAANTAKIKARKAAYLAANPEAIRVKNQNRRALKKAVGGKLSKGLADKLLKLQKGKCACCGEPLGDDYHLDHIMPLALGGSNTDDNMQLLRQRCNLQKHSKHPVDFMQSRGFLL